MKHSAEKQAPQNIQPSTSTPPEKPSEVFTGKGKRNRARRENHRETKSVEFDQTAKKSIYDKLYFGFRTEQEALRNLQVVSTPRSVILAVTTRAVGFIVRTMICKFFRLGIRNLPFHQLCCALYRVTLRQFEFKITLALQDASTRNRGTGFVNTFVDFETTQALGSLGAGFSPLMNLVSAIGTFSAFGTQYIPRLSDQMSVACRHTYDPVLVTFSTLRRYVVALSLATTPVEVRRYFYDHSPFPNAIWDLRRQRQREEEDVIDPILVNPNDIMPDNYDHASLLADINIITDAIEIIGRKYEKYVYVGGLSYHSPGNWSQLVSNNVEEIRCTDLTAGEQGISYNIANPLEYDTSFFWALEMISEPEFYLGALHLLGELPNPKTVPCVQFQNRSESSGKKDGSFSYASGLLNLLG